MEAPGRLRGLSGKAARPPSDLEGGLPAGPAGAVTETEEGPALRGPAQPQGSGPRDTMPPEDEPGGVAARDRPREQ